MLPSRISGIIAEEKAVLATRLADIDSDSRDDAILAAWTAANASQDYDHLGGVLAKIDAAPSLIGTESLYQLRGSIRQRRSELTLASDAYFEGHARFPENNVFPYEAGLIALDANYYGRAQAMIRTLADRMESLTDRQCRGVWRGGALAGLHDIARRAFDVATARGSELVSDAVGARLSQAIETQAQMRREPVRIVSLGNNCFPWMVLNRWGLRADPASATEDTVFNLGQCSGHTAADVLRAPQDLIAASDLEVQRHPDGGPIPWHGRFAMLFNHEGGELWIADNFARLIDRYTPRVANLIDALEGDPRIFVYYVEGDPDLNDLVAAVADANLDENYTLVIVDTRPEPRARPASHPRLRYLEIELPSSTYIWHVPDQFDSDLGVRFERSVANAILKESSILYNSFK